MSEKNILLDFIEVYETKYNESPNEYLKLGWLLFTTHVIGYGDPTGRDEKTVYCLGWLKSKGDPTHPKSDHVF